LGDSVTVKVSGLREVEERLIAAGPKIARGIFKQALWAVGDMWVAEASSRVPVLTGDLRDSIAAEVLIKKQGKVHVGSVTVGPAINTKESRSDGRNSVGPGVYGMWVEFGLKKKPYPKQPFLRPTFDATADKAVTMFADTLKAGLDDVMRLSD
jgi:HK97 gp10 family phage protein